MPKTRKGFTLIELLIVVMIIGILAAIAIPKFADMKSDLKNMVSGAEASFSENNSYALYAAPTGSAGARLSFVGTPTGWSATATHASSTKTCRIVVGSAAGPGVTEGEPRCI